jgi:hypothetical protein
MLAHAWSKAADFLLCAERKSEGLDVLQWRTRGMEFTLYYRGDLKANCVPTFRRDPAVPPHCQQTSTTLYRHPTQRYDRGHLVPANHLDSSARALQQMRQGSAT